MGEEKKERKNCTYPACSLDFLSSLAKHLLLTAARVLTAALYRRKILRLVSDLG